MKKKRRLFRWFSNPSKPAFWLFFQKPPFLVKMVISPVFDKTSKIPIFDKNRVFDDFSLNWA
jgi:hypothetical protein